MIRINLLKPEKKDLKDEIHSPAGKAQEKKKPDLTKLIIFFFVILIAALFFIQKNALKKEKRLFLDVQAEKEKLQHVFSKLEELERQKALYEKKIDLIKKLKSEQETPVKIMDGLTDNIPSSVWLTQSSYENHFVQIKGKAFSNNSIADYIFQLENDPCFDEVNLIASIQKKIKNNQIHEFSLTAKYVLNSNLESQEESSEKPTKGKEK